ncbi:Major vault protein [Pelomyxa schiedti]|nr:Major vault protein [Pelomyxa schiedti]
MSRRTCLIKVAPFHYLHVLDVNTLVTRLEVGPKTFLCREHERVILGPKEMLIIPPRNYCIVKNPVIRDQKHNVVVDKDGQAQLRHGDLEIRFEQEDPFPLFPGEALLSPITPFQVVAPNTALRLHAHLDFEETVEIPVNPGKVEGNTSSTPTLSTATSPTTKVMQVKRKAGEEWLFMGPATYKPRVEVEVVETRKAHIILPDTALKLAANRACIDCNGTPRKAGEQWLVRAEGAYMPDVEERVVDTVKAIVLTPKTALQLRARLSFEDRFRKYHKKGEEWLVTMKDAESYIPDVGEEVVTTVNITTLTSRQYCIIRDYYDETGVQHFGCRKILLGEQTFFLQPGEQLEGGVREIYVLGEEEALELICKEEFDDRNIRLCGGFNFGGFGFRVGGGASAVVPSHSTTASSRPARQQVLHRKPGTRWFVYGPGEYIPPLECDVIRRWNKLFVLPAPLNMRVITLRPAVISLIVLIIALLLMKIIF